MARSCARWRSASASAASLTFCSSAISSSIPFTLALSSSACRSLNAAIASARRSFASHLAASASLRAASTSACRLFAAHLAASASACCLSARVGFACACCAPPPPGQRCPASAPGRPRPPPRSTPRPRPQARAGRLHRAREALAHRVAHERLVLCVHHRLARRRRRGSGPVGPRVRRCPGLRALSGTGGPKWGGFNFQNHESSASCVPIAVVDRCAR